MQAVIMAGGKGTRLSSITNDEIPKPMVKLNEKPILEYQIEVLRANGITEYYFVVGHLGGKIQEYFGNGDKWKIHIHYIHEDKPLGTAGALYYLKDKLHGDFFLSFGDLIYDIDITRFLEFHQNKRSLLSLLVHPNAHPFDSDLIVLDANSKVIKCDSKNNVRDYYYSNIVNAGLYIMNESVLECVSAPEKMDLEKDIIFPMIEDQSDVYGYCTSEYVKDVGTPERLLETEKDLSNGIVNAKNLRNKQKAIFLDRDGTINVLDGLLADIDKFEIEPDVPEAIKLINKSEFLVIVITNQPVVARGMCSIGDVDEIHKKMETLLGKQGAYLDQIKYCPHHPDKGYPEENPIYKIQCKCRKPQIGLLKECADKYNIDLVNSWMVGDTTIDIQTGINAGTHTALVKTGMAGTDGKYSVKPDMVEENLLSAVKKIIYH